MLQRRTPALTPEEARKLRYEALVIDAQQPPATSGVLFTERMGRRSTSRKLRNRIRTRKPQDLSDQFD